MAWMLTSKTCRHCSDSSFSMFSTSFCVAALLALVSQLGTFLDKRADVVAGNGATGRAQETQRGGGNVG